jgi:hypothetical protein
MRLGRAVRAADVCVVPSSARMDLGADLVCVQSVRVLAQELEHEALPWA